MTIQELENDVCREQVNTKQLGMQFQFKLRVFLYNYTSKSKYVLGDHLQEAKICTKYMKHSKRYVSFQLSGLTGLFWAVQCTENFCKYPTAFSSFHEPKNYKIRVSKHYTIRSKTLMNVKVRKRPIWALKHTILG